jgi:hypothetical protein
MNEYPLEMLCVYLRANACDFNRHVFKEFVGCIIHTLYFSSCWRHYKKKTRKYERDLLGRARDADVKTLRILICVWEEKDFSNSWNISGVQHLRIIQFNAQLYYSQLQRQLFFYNGITFYSFLGSDICRPAAHTPLNSPERIAEIQTHKCGMQIVCKCRWTFSQLIFNFYFVASFLKAKYIKKKL